jgi:hypothetical protein
MNHVLENALIVGALLCVFIIPVIFVARQSRIKRKQKLAALLQAVIDAHGLTLNKSVQIGERLLGWDSSKKIVVLIDGTDKEPQVTSLPSVVSCHVLKTHQNTTLQSIQIQFANLHNQVLHSVCLYQQYKDNEMQLKEIEKQVDEWENWFNAHVK